jgi:hypothetical protein
LKWQREREQHTRERGRAAVTSAEERERAAASLRCRWKRERVSSRREWRKKKNDENLCRLELGAWSLDRLDGWTWRVEEERK